MKCILVTLLVAALSSVDATSEDLSIIPNNEGSGNETGSTRGLYHAYAWFEKNLGFGASPGVEKLKEDVKFFLHTNKNNPNEYEVATLNCSELFHSFNPELPTKIITHGWHNSWLSHIEQDIKDAYLKNYDVNVICVDWSSLSYKAYHRSKADINDVATILALFIDRLSTELKSDNSKLHLIGHSLGAHISGIAARQVKTGRVSRITGMDPAQPMFDMSDVMKRLGSDSADFVEVIHTGGKRLGTRVPLGHVDLFPNGGDAVQVGCGMDVEGRCSHARSHRYFYESLLNPNAFVGYACSDWETFKAGKCLDGAKYYMGENVNTTARGRFYFRTAAQSPYGLGETLQAFSLKDAAQDNLLQNLASKMFGWMV